jgi:hypothetical protein
MTAGWIIALVLLGATTAEAAHAHAPRRTVAARRACSAQKTTLRQFKRTPHSFGGPIAQPSQRVLIGLTDPMTRITRATETDDDDDSAAIQNDAQSASTSIRGVCRCCARSGCLSALRPRARARPSIPPSRPEDRRCPRNRGARWCGFAT